MPCQYCWAPWVGKPHMPAIFDVGWANYLQKILPGHAVRLHFLEQDEMATAVDNALLDIVFTNPAHYIRLRSSNLLTGAIATQVTLHAGQPVSQLGGVIIKRKDNDSIKTLPDLEGKTVAILGRQYLGGYTAQAAHLRKKGIDLDRIQFMALGNPHDKVVDAVLDKRADAGFIRTGILEAMQAEGRTDNAQRILAEQELERMGFYDALTGIPNRRLLVDRLHQAVAQAQRTNETLAVCMLDLDGFKPVNDHYGHDAGDHLLIEIANRLLSLVRAEDTVARLGGDEFTLILRRAGSTAIFDKILESLRSPVTLGHATVTVSASIGVAYFDGSDPIDADDLLKHADQALYAAKHNGRNNYVVYKDKTASRAWRA